MKPEILNPKDRELWNLAMQFSKLDHTVKDITHEIAVLQEMEVPPDLEQGVINDILFLSENLGEIEKKLGEVEDRLKSSSEIRH